jgi:branched-chain amino acid transport system substrate-binding protein
MKMNKMFKNRAGFGMMGIIISIIVVIVALVVFFTLRLQKEEAIKIGAVLSISGPGGYYGEAVRDGMLLAVDEINTWGGINGREIDLIIEDSKTNPQEGKEGFKRIEATHHPLFYISTLSSVSMALVPLAEQSKVVLVGLSVASHTFTQQNKWVFRYWITARDEVPIALSTLKALKVKDLGILYLNDEYGTSVFELLKEGFEKTGGTVRAEAFDVKVSDFKAQIVKLKDREAIYCVGYESQLKNVFKQLKKESFKGNIVSTNAPSLPLFRGLPESSGVYVSAPAVYNPRYLFAKEFMEKYESRYKKPFNHFVANGYDFIRLLAGLLEDKEISRQSVKNLLEDGFIYTGVFGDLDVKRGQHDITFPLHPARIVDGEVKYLR